MPASFHGDWEFLWQDFFSINVFFLSLSLPFYSFSCRTPLLVAAVLLGQHFLWLFPFSQPLLTWTLPCYLLPNLEDLQTSFSFSLRAERTEEEVWFGKRDSLQGQRDPVWSAGSELQCLNFLHVLGGTCSLPPSPLLLFDHSVSSAITLLACGSSHPQYPFSFFHCFIYFSLHVPLLLIHVHLWNIFPQLTFSAYISLKLCLCLFCVCVCVSVCFLMLIFFWGPVSPEGSKSSVRFVYLYLKKRYSSSLLTWFKGLGHLCPPTWWCSHKHLGSLLYPLQVPFPLLERMCHPEPTIQPTPTHFSRLKHCFLQEAISDHPGV